MSTSGTTLVTDAAVKAGILGLGETQTAEEQQFCLRELNRMLQEWSNERLMIYDVKSESMALTAGVAGYNLQSIINQPRPQMVHFVTVTSSGVVYPVEIIGFAEYWSIGVPSVQGIPSRVYIEWQDDALMQFTFFPVPNGAYTCNLQVSNYLTQNFDGTTLLTMPVGYEPAIIDNLAVRLAPAFGLEAKPSIQESAIRAKMALKRKNVLPDKLGLSLPFYGQYSIQGDRLV